MSRKRRTYQEIIDSTIPGIDVLSLHEAYLAFKTNPNIYDCIGVTSFEGYFNLLNLEYSPKLVTELFDQWDYAEDLNILFKKKPCNSPWDNIISPSYLYTDYCCDGITGNYSIPTPKTIGAFISDCNRVGMELYWKCDLNLYSKFILDENEVPMYDYISIQFDESEYEYLDLLTKDGRYNLLREDNKLVEVIYVGLNSSDCNSRIFKINRRFIKNRLRRCKRLIDLDERNFEIKPKIKISPNVNVFINNLIIER